GSLVPQIGRFSAQPRLEDLRELTLDAGDIAEITRCRPEHCGLKLSAPEIERLHRVLESAGEGMRAPVDEEFRRIVLERARAYLRGGDDATASQFATLVQHSPYLEQRMPRLVAYLTDYPHAHLAGAESFLYWSKEVYAWKPMITLTHVTILRGHADEGAPEVLVASRDIY